MMQEKLEGYLLGISHFISADGAWLDLRNYALSTEGELESAMREVFEKEGWLTTNIPSLSKMSDREFKHSIDAVFRKAIKPPVGNFALAESFYEIFRVEYGKFEVFGTLISEEDLVLMYATQIPNERILYVLRCGFWQ